MVLNWAPNKLLLVSWFVISGVSFFSWVLSYVPQDLNLGCKSLSMREGVKATLVLGLKNICIEGDNLVVINSLRKCWKVPLKIYNFICDAVVELSPFFNVTFNHCSREANQAADFSMYKDHTCQTLHRWFEMNDLVLLSIIHKDVLASPYHRN